MNYVTIVLFLIGAIFLILDVYWLYKQGQMYRLRWWFLLPGIWFLAAAMIVHSWSLVHEFTSSLGGR